MKEPTKEEHERFHAQALVYLERIEAIAREAGLEYVGLLLPPGSARFFRDEYEKMQRTEKDSEIKWPLRAVSILHGEKSDPATSRALFTAASAMMCEAMLHLTGPAGEEWCTRCMSFTVDPKPRARRFAVFEADGHQTRLQVPDDETFASCASCRRVYVDDGSEALRRLLTLYHAAQASVIPSKGLGGHRGPGGTA